MQIFFKCACMGKQMGTMGSCSGGVHVCINQTSNNTMPSFPVENSTIGVAESVPHLIVKLEVSC